MTIGHVRMKRLRVVSLAALLALITSPPWLADAVGGQGDTVIIQDGHCYGGNGGNQFCYSPPDFAVDAGTTVMWANHTSFAHTLSRCGPAACTGATGGTGSDAFGDNQQIDADATH